MADYRIDKNTAIALSPNPGKAPDGFIWRWEYRNRHGDKICPLMRYRTFEAASNSVIRASGWQGF